MKLFIILFILIFLLKILFFGYRKDLSIKENFKNNSNHSEYFEYFKYKLSNKKIIEEKILSNKNFIGSCSYFFENIFILNNTIELKKLINNQKMYIVPIDILKKKNNPLYNDNLSNIIFIDYFSFYFFKNKRNYNLYSLKNKKIAILYDDEISFYFLKKLLSFFKIKNITIKKMNFNSILFDLDQLNIDIFFMVSTKFNKYISYCKKKYNTFDIKNLNTKNLSFFFEDIELNNHILSIPGYLVTSRNTNETYIYNFLNFIKKYFGYLVNLELLPSEFKHLFRDNIIENHQGLNKFMLENGIISEVNNKLCNLFAGRKKCTNELILKYDNNKLFGLENTIN